MPILDNDRTTVKNNLQLHIKTYSKKSIADSCFFIYESSYSLLCTDISAIM